ncbi:coiled-coil domain-containing protein [Arthrobacter koreensis]|uniref:hypothetical protein n=1 Tax=Arthrobacter koreensis TaxID=199136 RepID=UPI0038089F5E
MALRKKSRAATTDTVASAESEGGGVAVAAPASRKKRKPQEMLSSVVKESTAGAAVALLRENQAFALPSGKSWVVLGLAVERIGGLSVKQKNDEAKGSLIELITADHITTVATLDMLEGETFGIIPSMSSLERMKEFGLLTNAPYFWVTLTHTPEGALIANAVAEATFADAVEIAEGRTTLAETLPAIWVWGGGTVGESPSPQSTDDEAPALDADDPFGDPVLTADETNPFGEDPEDVDYGALDAADDSGSEVDLSEFEKQFAEESHHDPALAEEQVPAEDFAVDTHRAPEDSREVDETEVRAAIARRFLSTDLNLEVDLQTFEVNFRPDSSEVLFPLDEEATDWLGRQVNQLARQANTELAALRARNRTALREKYVQLMSQHVEQVIADVSPDREGSFYFKLQNAAKEDLADRQRSAPEEVAALRRERIERFEAEAAARGRQAAEQAILRYREQHLPRHERDLAELGLANERASEELFAGAQQIILDTRRRDAQARMDLGKTKILEVLIEENEAQREREAELLQHWSAEMMKFVDANRKDDIARSEALAEQLSRSNQVDQLQAEHATRIAEMRRDQEQRVGELRQELDKVRTDALRDLEAREDTWKHKLSVEQQEATTAKTRVQDLLTQFNGLGDLYERQYKGRIEALESDKESYSKELDRAAVLQSRANKLWAVLIFVVALAFAGVGFLLGAGSAGSTASAAADLMPVAGMWLAEGLPSPAV